MRIRVIGLGSAHGDDAAGPLVARRLAAGPALPPGADAVACGDPLALLELLEGVDAAVLVDATRSGRAPGSVHEVRLEEVEARPCVSSHGLGLGEALGLARSLGRAPERIAIVGIEARGASGESVSPAVRAALGPAADRVRELCATWWREAAGRDRAEVARHA